MEKKLVLIASLEQACEQLNYPPEQLKLDVSAYPEDLQDSIQAFADLLIIHKAQQAGRTLDYNNRQQQKHYPVFDLETDANNPTGFRFHGSNFDYYAAFLAGGSRLCLHSEEEADHIGKTFAPLYQKIFI